MCIAHAPTTNVSNNSQFPRPEVDQRSPREYHLKAIVTSYNHIVVVRTVNVSIESEEVQIREDYDMEQETTHSNSCPPEYKPK